MTKRVCDKCGKFCEGKFSILSIQQYDRVYRGTAERDLCENCTNLLGEFFDGKTEQNETEVQENG